MSDETMSPAESAARDHAEVFMEFRPLLFTLAYEILGSVSDADDILQESYLRWRGVDLGGVEHLRRYLVQTVTRQSLNHLRTLRRRRETYIGNWLPEPLVTASEVDADAVLAEGLSMAMLVVLESLTPEQRVVFVLREVFGFSAAEIAEMTRKSEAAVRQLTHRARQSVQARRPRFEPEPEKAEELVARFLLAAQGGNLQELMDVLAPDVVQISDGGGKVAAARRPLTGSEDVARFSIGVARTSPPTLRVELIRCNAMPTALFWNGDRRDYALLFQVVEGRIRGLYAIRNPDKLNSLHRSPRVAR
ncbi:RNA polymerase sigma-70 factor [Gordonia terrae]|uniref:RNA polymerase sigma-70 factor n=1 Tax=Gordonia terrae TaxID=2055 RepID=UPI003F6BE262